MDLHVSLKISALIETAIAHGTLVRRLLEMGDFVNGESSRLTESLAAVVALERLLFGVNVSMISQVILTTEGLATDVATVWPLIGVSSLVNQKIVGFGEMTIAVFADELLLWSRSSRASDLQWTQSITSGY